MIKTTRTTLLVRTEFYGEYRPQHATQSTGQVYAMTVRMRKVNGSAAW